MMLATEMHVQGGLLLMCGEGRAGGRRAGAGQQPLGPCKGHIGFLLTADRGSLCHTLPVL